MFPALGVRENMTVQVLDDFATGGLDFARPGAGAACRRWRTN